MLPRMTPPPLFAGRARDDLPALEGAAPVPEARLVPLVGPGGARAEARGEGRGALAVEGSRSGAARAGSPKQL